VQDLFPGALIEGRNPGSDKGQLVEAFAGPGPGGSLSGLSRGEIFGDLKVFI